MRGIPSGVGFAMIVGLGIPLTELLALEWSVYLPKRRTALWLVIASAAWWYVSAALVQGEYGWRIWYPVNTVMLVILTFSVGFWLAGEIEKAGHLIPVCVLGTLVDIWSVFHGPSRQVAGQVMEHQQRMAEAGVQTPPPIVDFLILHWPYPGADMMATLLGLGDLVFVAMFLAASRRFGLSLPKAFLLILAGLALSTAVALWWSRPVPALPFICTLYLAGNARGMKLNRKEWIITIGTAVVILAVILANALSSLIFGGK
jgi:hypothetical protein